MKFLFALIFILAMSLPAAAENTTRKGPLRPRMYMPTEEYADTFRLASAELSPDSVVIASYDKPLRSMRETFFVTNRHRDVSLVSITLRLTYRRHDDGSMLHSRTVTVSHPVPPGETRQLYATSWDRQYNYYYHATRIRPRSSLAVAYDVEITPLSALFER
ncbi:hypothetical protein [uncultured Muribaculum sp.]|uniref:hypothetical protein n=1 Tax=uncultured Muribaculum sp. TaxID=1918613 RepID=UPI0025D8F3C3|nr:hypothetical protein [uncultured Muribaculum sp.]